MVDGAPAGGPELSKELIETLRDAQRLGFFGSAPIEDAGEHARAFVVAVGDLPPGARVADLGSGGGLPGLVLCAAYPSATVVMIDRREKRTDFLRRATRRLGFEHGEVVTGEVTDVARAVEQGAVTPFDVVTARGFGPPAVTLRLARRLAATSGCVVISEPPEGDRWDPGLLGELRVRITRVGPVARFDRLAP